MSPLALAVCPPPPRLRLQLDDNQFVPSVPVSPSSAYSSLPSLSNSCCTSISSESTSNGTLGSRGHEHLAVLLPKHLWKPDSRAIHCENFFCRVKFSLFERRHHCRKCGGIFCQMCSSRTTLLLDTSNLSFIYPPRGVSLTAFESPTSPILPARVCDECWHQIHGNPRLNADDPGPAPALQRSKSLPPQPFSSSPARDRPLSLHSSQSVSSLLNLRQTYSIPPTVEEITTPIFERSFGELDAYPLRVSSAVCKARGGGRWVPKNDPPYPGHRAPGGKAPFEIEMEREEEEERLRRLNPIVKDGVFQYRFPREPEPPTVTNWNYPLSTF